MEREASEKIALLKSCGCKVELESMWLNLPHQLKVRDDVQCAKDERKAELIRAQKEAA